MIKRILLGLVFVVLTTKSYSQNYDSLVNDGLKLLQQGKPYQAIEKYNKALNIDSSKVDAIYGVGVAYLFICQSENKYCERSILYLNKSIEVNPKYRNSYYNRGRCKVLLEDYHGALADLNKAIKLNSSDKDFYFTRALIKIKTNDNQGACEDFFQSAKLGSQEAAKMFELNCGIQ
jgi:tetratricopeptide (TPR) repeat protein